MTINVQQTTREATLSFLLKEGVSSAARLAKVMKISVQAMRRHLRSLELEGFVAATSISEGPGRPSNSWQLTLQGQNLFNNGSGSEKFALELMNSIEDSLPSEIMNTLLSNQSRQKAYLYKKLVGTGNLTLRLEKLVQLRNAEGYMAEIHPMKDGSSSWILNAFHCSIRAIAEKYPVVCDQELQLIRSIFDDCQVMRTQWRLESGHSCAFKITPLKS